MKMFLEIFKTDEMLVFENGSNEVFIKNKKTEAQIRVSVSRNDMYITATGCEFRPTEINRLPAFEVIKRPILCRYCGQAECCCEKKHGMVEEDKYGNVL